MVQVDEIRAGGEWWVAVAGQDGGDVEGQAEAEPGVGVVGGSGQRGKPPWRSSDCPFVKRVAASGPPRVCA
jgi:hypothetical protein